MTSSLPPQPPPSSLPRAYTSDPQSQHHHLSPLPHFDAPMNPQTLPPPHGLPNGHALRDRRSGEFGPLPPSQQQQQQQQQQQHRSSLGGMPAPAGGGQHGNGHATVPVPLAGPRVGSASRVAGFEGARSPPNSKNTSHVPCKFFRQGTCQAGQACPFLHSEAVGLCKYFQKGNCKFGMRCANEHITQDGRRVNKGVITGQAQMVMGGRGMPMPVGPPSLLTLQHDMYAQPHLASALGPEDYMRRGSWTNTSAFDTTYTSHPGSAFGSPPTDGRSPLSPLQKGLSVMDVPLPASFDSQGISHYAKAGPFAASVPARFGFDTSPPSSLPRPVGESSVIRNLRSSAFGEDTDKSSMTSSPPVTGHDTLASRRLMHSERFSSKLNNPLSMSLGTRIPTHGTAEEWDDNFAFEEELVPDSLRDLLTPQEKIRRFSRNADDDSSLSRRLSFSNLGTPVGETFSNSSKVGSPSNASPGSRFGAFFSSRENRDSGSAFGVVGSPLRNSSLNLAAAGGAAGDGSPSLRPAKMNTSTGGETNFFVSSPPRQASMSMISQQLQRTRLQSRASETSLGAEAMGGSSSSHAPQQQHQQQNQSQGNHPPFSRVTSTSSVSSSTAGAGHPPHSTNNIPAARIDRTISSTSINRERIDEEQGGVFSMDDEESSAVEMRATGRPAAVGFKRNSGGGGVWSLGKASPRLGDITGQGDKMQGQGQGQRGPWNS